MSVPNTLTHHDVRALRNSLRDFDRHKPGDFTFSTMVKEQAGRPIGSEMYVGVDVENLHFDRVLADQGFGARISMGSRNQPLVWARVQEHEHEGFSRYILWAMGGSSRQKFFKRGNTIQAVVREESS